MKTIPMLYTRGTRLWPNAEIVEVGDGIITIHGETGADMTITCDTVIEAMDMLRNMGLIASLGMVLTETTIVEIQESKLNGA